MPPPAKVYIQQYNKSWEADPELKDWIAISEGSTNRAFCRYCKTSLIAHKKDLLKHATSKKHLREVGASLQVKHMKPLNVVCKKPRALKVAELKLSAFIAEHCSIKCIDHLGELIRALDPSSATLKDLKLHRTKCTMLIKNVIGPCILEDLVADVGDSNYSLIIDESTDLCAVKTLCLMIKYFSVKKKKVITTFYRIIALPDCKAQDIFDAVTAQLEKDQLIVKNLIGIGTDGANVMVGAHCSLAQLLKSIIPDLILIKCICHSLHLCAEYACRELPRQLEFLIRECHNYFSISPKRLHAYKLFCGSTSVKKIPKLAGTRWLAREGAVSAVLEQWDDLFAFFKIANVEDKCFAAEQLLKIMSIPAHKAFLIFLKHILTPICKTNRLFQSTNADILLLFQDLLMLYKSCLSKIVVPAQLEKVRDHDIMDFKFQEHLAHVDSIYLGYEFEVQAKLVNAVDIADVRQRCANFLVAFCCQLQQRLPQNISILEKINVFRPDICTAQTKPRITEIVSQFERFPLHECETEWDLLSTKKWGDQIMDLNSFWSAAYFESDSAGNPRFKNIGELALSLLSLPISNAVVERAFSVYNVIKDKLRNKLSLDVIQSILLVRYYLKNEEISCKDFEPTDKMILLFKSKMYDHVTKATESEYNEILNDINCITEVEANFEI